MTGHPDCVVPVRLLLAEDSENNVMLLLRELRRGGYEPHYERVRRPEPRHVVVGGDDLVGLPASLRLCSARSMPSGV